MLTQWGPAVGGNASRFFEAWGGQPQGGGVFSLNRLSRSLRNRQNANQRDIFLLKFIIEGQTT